MRRRRSLQRSKHLVRGQIISFIHLYTILYIAGVAICAILSMCRHIVLNSYSFAFIIIAGVLPYMIYYSWKHFNEESVMSSEVIGGTVIDNTGLKRLSKRRRKT